MSDGKLSLKSISVKIGEGDFVFEAGKLAGQASGAVLARLGDTVVFAATIMSATGARRH